MKKLRFASVGFDFPSDHVENLGFYSNASLLDFDAIVFSPIVNASYRTSHTYRGKPCFDDDDSFALKNAISHWSRELGDALEHGKSIFVYLCKPETIHIATGDKEYSGTGRNRKETRIVTPVSNYDSLPFEIEQIDSTGTKMSLAPGFVEMLQSYWSLAEARSSFRLILEYVPGATCIKTQTGDKPVGSAIGYENSDGIALLLPYLELDDEEFTKESAYGDYTWTQAGLQFGSRLLEQLVGVHKSARQRDERTIRPEWAEEGVFLLQ